MNFFKKDKNQSTDMDLGNYDDSQIPVQLKKIIDHLGFLEKKLDTLLEQSRHRSDSRPSISNRNFSGARGGHYRPNPREGFGGQKHSSSSDNRGNDNRGNRYEGNRHARHGNHSGRPYQKKYTPHASHGSPAPQRSADQT